MREYQNWINGQPVAPTTENYIERISPADGTILAKFPRSGYEDVNNAVAVAQKLHGSGQLLYLIHIYMCIRDRYCCK